MIQKVVLVSNGASSKNISFIVVSISHMSFLLEIDVHKLRFISSHVFGTTTVQVPHLHVFLKAYLQKRNSSNKIWSPYKCGSFGINFIMRNLKILGNPSLGTKYFLILQNLTEWPLFMQ